MTTQQIWTELSNHLLNFILTKVKVREDAEDILTEVFEKVHLNLHKLENKDKPEAWVFAITRNAINDYYKTANKAITLYEEHGTENQTSREQELLTKLQACMLNMMNLLPDKYREPLIMGELDGKNQQEVANAFGLSLPGAKSRIQRGRKMLKEMLVECCKVDINEKRQIKTGSVTEMACNC